MFVSKREYTLLTNELRYYRELFISERARGDRASDALLQSRGVMPVSDLGIEKVSEAEEHALESMKLMQNQLAEIYGDGVDEPMEPEEEDHGSVKATTP